MKLSTLPHRKHLLILIFVFVCFLSSLSAIDNHFQLLQQTQKTISLQFNLGSWNVASNRTNGTDYQTIEAAGANFIYIDETATLPTYSTLVAIPEGMDVRVRYSNQSDDFISSFRMESEALLQSNLIANAYYPAEQFVVSAPAQ